METRSARRRSFKIVAILTPLDVRYVSTRSEQKANQEAAGILEPSRADLTEASLLP
jgi:hypothetical protein